MQGLLPAMASFSGIHLAVMDEGAASKLLDPCNLKVGDTATSECLIKEAEQNAAIWEDYPYIALAESGKGKAAQVAALLVELRVRAPSLVTAFARIAKLPTAPDEENQP